MAGSRAGYHTSTVILSVYRGVNSRAAVRDDWSFSIHSNLAPVADYRVCVGDVLCVP